jgi:hypothetical protein
MPAVSIGRMYKLGEYRLRTEGDRVAVRRLLFAVSVAIAGVIMGLLLEEKAEAGLRVVEGVPVSSSATSALDVVDPVTLTHHVHLPIVCRSFPPVAQVPEGKYLFVEYWTHSFLGAGCAGLCVDFPTYAFEPQSGELTIYTTDPPEPALLLGEGEIGYLGTGESLMGNGCGASSSLSKVQAFPFSKDEITLRYVDEAGVATLERQDETLILQPGETWVSDEEVETWDWLGAGCVVTSTHHIMNHAYQDRNQIEYASVISATEASLGLVGPALEGER